MRYDLQDASRILKRLALIVAVSALHSKTSQWVYECHFHAMKKKLRLKSKDRGRGPS